MSEFLSNPEYWLSLIAVVVSLITLILTYKQIGQSNKLQLLDRRISKYNLICDLVHLYSENKTLIDNDTLYQDVKMPFSWLTNNTYLAKMYPVMEKPLSQPEQNEFLTEVEKITNDAFEITIIFIGEESKIASDFVRQYMILLKLFYKQQIALNYLQEQNKELPMTEEIFNRKALESFNNFKIDDAINNLSETYDKIICENVLEKLLKQVKP